MTEFPVKELSEMLDSVSEKIPKLMKGLINSLYSAEAGKNMGQAVGNFYREIVEAGVPHDEALKMAKDYMLSIKDIASNMGKSTETNNHMGKANENE